MKAVIFPILLLSLPLLAGCSEPEEEPGGFTLHLHNVSGYDLYERIFINGQFSGGPRWIGSSDGGGARSQAVICPHNSSNFEGVDPDDPFTFKLVMEFRGGVVFAEESRVMQCGGEFAAWVHPDGYIVFDDEGGRYSSPPWE